MVLNLERVKSSAPAFLFPKNGDSKKSLVKIYLTFPSRELQIYGFSHIFYCTLCM